MAEEGINKELNLGFEVVGSAVDGKSELTLDDIAKSLNFSADYLSRIYKKSTGQSPLKYLIHLRINEAKRLLTTDLDLEIKTIGELVGYTDQYYFSRIFKNQTEHYPSEYRSLKK